MELASDLQVRVHVRGADRQGDRVSSRVLAGEPTAGPIRDIVVQEEQ